MSEEVRFTHLRPGEFVGRREAASIAWLPLGTLEWHGHHMPLGLDGLKAQLLCEVGARELGGVVFPTMYYGDHRGMVVEALLTRDCVFSPDDALDHREAVNEALGTDPQRMAAQGARDESRAAQTRHADLLLQSLWTLRSYGFSSIVAIAGHYPIAGPLSEAVTRFETDQESCRVIHGTELLLAGGNPRAVRHADSYETSQLLALAPHLADLAALRETARCVGVVGDDPATATPEDGARIVAAFLAGVRARLANERRPPPRPIGPSGADEDGQAPAWPGMNLRRGPQAESRK